MKTVFTTQEGVKMNSSLNLGDISSITHEFQYFLETTETMWDEDFKYFYRVTDDNYIQLGYSLGDDEKSLIAQYKLRNKNLKENIIFVVKNNIEAHSPFIGYPRFQNSSVFTKQEFEEIIATIKNEKFAISKNSLENITPLITFLKENNLNPIPSGDTPTNWKAQCPSGRGHFIMVSTKNDEWGCGYCCKKGKQAELESWLQEIV